MSFEKKKMLLIADYEKIESIKSALSLANWDRSELWVQRQNVQDLCYNIFINDLNFAIDKKLEQDLWNLVFKNLINNFQSQIKELGTLANVSAIASANNTKKIEIQARFSFFLDAALGFYTKLLQDILINNVSNQNHKLLNVYPISFENFLNMKGSSKYSNTSVSKQTNEKQILYICQNILTHLGDISRYQTQFDQAKNYYLNAIKLVSYLGNPYHQLAILYESTRTNQLETVFYYIRSIALRYPFPLGSANLDKFYKKILEKPVARYPASNLGSNLTSTSVSISHKDLVMVFMIINAMVYRAKPEFEGKLVEYLELFKNAFKKFIEVPMQRDKLTKAQLIQIISILFFSIDQETTTNELTKYAVELLLFLLHQFFIMTSDQMDNMLPAIYLSLTFIELFRNGAYVENNKLWSYDQKLTESYCDTATSMLNKLIDSVRKQYEISPNLRIRVQNNSAQYPLSEDRMLESFSPMKMAHKNFSFETVKASDQLFECVLRKQRIVECVKRILEKNQADQRLISTRLVQNENAPFEFTLSSQKGSMGEPITESPLNISLEMNSSKLNESVLSNQSVQIPRKKRQNVALFSMTQSVNPFQNTSEEAAKTNSSNVPHFSQPERLNTNRTTETFFFPSAAERKFNPDNFFPQ